MGFVSPPLSVFDRVWRVTRGLISLLLVSVPCIMGIPLLAILYITLLPLNPTRWAQVTTALSSWYYMFWIIVIEYIAKVDVVITGDVLPYEESALLISNHCSTMDPFFMFTIAARRFRIGNVKFFAKKVIRTYFPFGPAMALVDCIFIDRDWTTDSSKIQAAFHSLNSRPTVPVWLMSFLEGHRKTPETLSASAEFARSRSLPILQETLYPRVKGLYATFAGARSLLDAVYDITIAFPNGPPTLFEFFSGGPGAQVHLHVVRHSMADIPFDCEENLQNWIYKIWEQKEHRLLHAKKYRQFSSVRNLEPMRLFEFWYKNISHGLMDERLIKDSRD
uniref:Phospholipid/glycerol acyltransferase domain-containing protein n=1 Tax=Spongospora subterranea TaxID=70186 RepID=A0A0H5R7Z8_9EUKA|eukprot:CRZ09852.1 hypothetical protein [Spongospora subterranea]